VTTLDTLKAEMQKALAAEQAAIVALQKAPRFQVIDCVNESTVLSDADCAKYVAAVQTQVTRDFFPLWGIGAKLNFIPSGGKPSADSWWMVFADDASMANALGYHSLSDNGSPLGYVFCKADLDNGSSISVTLSHEVCLAGETIVPLADGSRPNIETIARRGGFSARKTGSNKQTVRVIFTDGSSIKCTSNHRFLRLSGDFSPASSLAPGDMLPAATSLDRVNGSGAYSVPLCDNRPRLGGIMDFQNLLRCENGVARSLTPGLPSFGVHVGFVVGVSSDKEMSRINTPPHVATMADKHTIRNGAISHFVTNAMRVHQFSAHPDHSVSPLRNATSPKPTFVVCALADLRPKSLLKRGGTAIKKRIAAKRPGVCHSGPMRSTQSLGPEWSSTSEDRARLESLTNRHCRVVYRIERDDKCDVYDLTIPDRHNFAVGNGVFVHNCEMLADPQINMMCQLDETRFVAAEVNDPVESDSDGYEIDGVLVSDFVLPSYFSPGNPAPYDFRKLLSEGMPALRPDGYLSIYVIGQGWTQIDAATNAKMKMKAMPYVGSRRQRRATPRKDWVKSEVGSVATSAPSPASNV
jgi:hypothetical protein